MWNPKVFVHLDSEKWPLKEGLKELEESEVSAPLSVEDSCSKFSITLELENVLLIKEILCRQKSWSLWLKEGDCCTKFFNRVADSHHRNNAIKILQVDGQM